MDFIAHMNADTNYHLFGPTIEEQGTINRGYRNKERLRMIFMIIILL